MTKKLKITQVKSRIGSQRRHKETMEALGIHKNYTTVYRNDNPAVRGMLNRVSHLVRWEEIDEKDIPEKAGISSGVTVVSAGGGKRRDSVKSEEKSD